MDVINGIPALDYFDIIDVESYGHDDAEIEEYNFSCDANIVNVPITETSQSLLALWTQHINPLEESNMYGADLYCILCLVIN